MNIARRQLLRLLGAAAGASAVDSVLPTAAEAAGTQSTTEQVVRRDVVVIGGGSAGTYSNAATFPVVLDEFAAFSSHTPYAMHVPAASIAAGFYRDLHALQGRNRTFYNSAALHSNNSSRIWAATDAVLSSLSP